MKVITVAGVVGAEGGNPSKTRPKLFSKEGVVLGFRGFQLKSPKGAVRRLPCSC